MKHNDWIRDPETGEWGQVQSLRCMVYQKAKEWGGPLSAVLAMGFFVYVVLGV